MNSYCKGPHKGTSLWKNLIAKVHTKESNCKGKRYGQGPLKGNLLQSYTQRSIIAKLHAMNLIVNYHTKEYHCKAVHKELSWQNPTQRNPIAKLHAQRNLIAKLHTMEPYYKLNTKEP